MRGHAHRELQCQLMHNKFFLPLTLSCSFVHTQKFRLSRLIQQRFALTSLKILIFIPVVVFFHLHLNIRSYFSFFIFKNTKHSGQRHKIFLFLTYCSSFISLHQVLDIAHLYCCIRGIYIHRIALNQYNSLKSDVELLQYKTG